MLGEGKTIAEVGELGGGRADLPPVAQPVRRDEGRRRQAAEGARAGERAAEADRGRRGVGERALKEIAKGNWWARHEGAGGRDLRHRLRCERAVRLPRDRAEPINATPPAEGGRRRPALGARAARFRRRAAAVRVSTRLHAPALRAGRSITSGCNGSGARRASACRGGAQAPAARRLHAPRTAPAARPGVWAVDFQFDSTTDGRPVKMLHSSTSTPANAWRCLVARSITDDDRRRPRPARRAARRGRAALRQRPRADRARAASTGAAFARTSTSVHRPRRRRGRTRTWSPSTAASATSCSNSSSSPAWPKRGS